MELKENLVRLVRECGVEAVVLEDGEAAPASDVTVYEIADAGDLAGLPGRNPSRPFLVFTGVEVAGDDLRALKDAGLAGVLRPDASAEEVAFLVNKALYYDKVINRNPRVAVNIPVELASGEKVVRTFASMLSRDGMFVVTLNPLPVDSEFAIEFALPDGGDGFKTTARVLYHISINKDLNIIANPEAPSKRLVTHPGMAIFFVDLPEESRSAIDRFIDSVA